MADRDGAAVLDRPAPPPPPPASTSTEGSGLQLRIPWPPERRTVGRVVTAVGVLLLLFLVYEVFVTAIVHQRNQDLLLDDFRATLLSGGGSVVAADDPLASGLLGDTVDATGEAVASPEFIAAPPPPEPGDPVALLQIPRIGLEQVVVQGTSAGDLLSGPGHLRSSPSPGQVGNAVIIGARVSKGAPFLNLDRLEEGDEIRVTTNQGGFVYRVVTVDRVAAGDPDPARRSRAARLTLITADPPLRASDRLVVAAKLDGQPVATLPGQTATGSDTVEDGFRAAPGALAWTFIAAQVLLLAVLFTRWVYRRWPLGAAWVVTTPILLTALILLYQAASGLLPAAF